MDDGSAENGATVVFLAVDHSLFENWRATESRRFSPFQTNLRLDLTLDPAVARARDIESKRPQRLSYLLSGGVRSSWLNLYLHNVVANGEIVQVGVSADELHDNMVDPWRCIAMYSNGHSLIVEVDSST